MRNLIAAILIATTVIFYAVTGKEAEEDEEAEPPEAYTEPTPPNVTAEGLAQIDAVRAERLAQVRADRLAEEKALAQRKADEKKARVVAQKKEVSRSKGYEGKAQSYEATAYTAYCPTGCNGVTASGHDVSKTIYYEDMRILAAPKHIPFYSIMRVTLEDGKTFEGIVLDRGGDIGNGRIDILVETQQEAYVHGRQSVEVRMIRRGQ